MVENKKKETSKYVVFLNKIHLKQFWDSIKDEEQIRVEFEEQENGSWVGQNKTLLSARDIKIR